MPRRAVLTERGRRLARGPRLVNAKARRPRSLGSVLPADTVDLVLLPDGTKLNKDESVIYRALQDLGIPFEAQKQFGPANELGGALLDFWVPVYNIAIEFNGLAFHATDTGRYRDWQRQITRQNNGALQVISLYRWDLPNIHQRLREIFAARTIIIRT